MSMEEFKFPDETEAKAKPAEEKLEFSVEGEEPVTVEVVDDTPPADRNRKPMTEPPKDVTDEELAKYDESVRKRIQHFTKGFHDERRAKEAALREREEALRLAQQLVEENKRLKTTSVQDQTTALAQAKKAAELELDKAKQKFRAAYDAGDTDAMVTAQEELASAKFRMERLGALRPPVQRTENEVQQQPQVVPQPAPAPQPQVDPRAQDWKSRNDWFGADEEMTSFALGVHAKLVNSGVDPTSDEYYEALDSRIRKVFPDKFETETPADAPTQRKSSNVAPATRSTAPRKLVLTKSQVAIAKKLGVPLELYAKMAAKEAQK